MKNISDILNSLFSSPSDKTSLFKGMGSVAPKGSQPNGNSFEDILAQMASQGGAPSANSTASDLPAAPGSSSQSPVNPGETTGAQQVPTGLFESFTSVSETSIAITESVKVDNLSQLAQAEQSLMSLAAGLSKLLNLFSNLQSMDPTQAQNALVSLGGGKISPDDAKALLSALQALAPKTGDTQNPLLLPSDQQNAFLNQMLQQMIQNQQVLFGTSTTNSTSSNNPGSSVGGVGLSTAGASNSLQTSDVVLQMAFSDTQITQIQQTNTQSSQVFIDLQTFQMSATFIQAGLGQTTGQSVNPNSSQSLQPLPASDSLSNALDQMFSNQLSMNFSTGSTVQNAAQNNLSNSSSAQDNLNQNFKNLVQMLVQSGASQAVLTTFLNQQRDLSNADLKQSLAQNVSMDQLAQSLLPNVQIPPVLPAGSTAVSANNTDNTRPSAGAQQLFFQETVSQASVAVETQNVSKADGTVSINQSFMEASIAQAALTIETQNVLPPNAPGSNISLSAPQAVPSSDTGTSEINPASQVGSQTAVSALNINVLDALNNVVERLNILALPGTGTSSTPNQGGDNSKPSLSIDQLMSVLNNPVPPQGPTDISNPSSNSVQASAPVIVSNPVDNSILGAAPNVSNPLNGSVLVNASINDLVALNNFIQTQSLSNSPSIASLNQPSTSNPPANMADITSISQTQLIQTVALGEQGSASTAGPTPDNASPAIQSFLNNQLPVGTTASSQPLPVTNNQVVNQTETNSLNPATTMIQSFLNNQPPVGTTASSQPLPVTNDQVVNQTETNSPNPATTIEAVSANAVPPLNPATSLLNNSPILTSPNLPLTVNVQTPVVLTPPAAPLPVSNNTVMNQPQPVSPVSITVQETVAPNAVDVQVKITEQPSLANQVNNLVPAATTSATTVPVSTAQNVSASVMTGVAVNSTLPNQTGVKSIDLNNQTATPTVSSVSEVKPVTPQALTPIENGSPTTTNLKVTDDLSKNNNLLFQNSVNVLQNMANLVPLKGSVVAPSSTPVTSNNFQANVLDGLHVLNQVSDQIMAHASEARAVSRLNFQLIPESLGRVTVQIALVDQSVSARIIVSNPDVRENLQHHMVELKTALNQAGLQIDQLQVQVQGGSSNLLAQYFQYQQEGYGYRLPTSAGSNPLDEPKTLENMGLLGEMSVRMSLLDVLA